MGEYVKYKNEEIKVGTCENLYYVTYPKYKEALDAGLLKQVPDNLPPEFYVKPDVDFRFRFPFPDEDHLPLEAFDTLKYNRTVPVPYQSPFTKCLLVMKFLQTRRIFISRSKNLFIACKTGNKYWR